MRYRTALALVRTLNIGPWTSIRSIERAAVGRFIKRAFDLPWQHYGSWYNLSYIPVEEGLGRCWIKVQRILQRFQPYHVWGWEIEIVLSIIIEIKREHIAQTEPCDSIWPNFWVAETKQSWELPVTTTFLFENCVCRAEFLEKIDPLSHSLLFSLHGRRHSWKSDLVIANKNAERNCEGSYKASTENRNHWWCSSC
jgi:hypothetical protein